MAYAGRKVQPGEVAERLNPSSVDDSSPVGGALAQAEALAALYADAEEKLFETIRKALLAGRGEPQYAGNRFNDVRTLRKQAEQVVNRLQTLAEKAARDGITDAWEEGLARAKDELAHLGDKDLITPGQGVAELVEQALGKLKSADEAALRTVDDIYRQVVAEVSGRALIGAETRREATVRALQKFAAKGITMFAGPSGRPWSISAYAEMATRTAMSRAAIDGHLKTLEENGRDLVMVSRPPYTCPICKPWEGKILTNGGQVGRRKEKSLATGRDVTVTVVATVTEARAAGLQHPNCRHNLMAYLPGVTKPPPEPPTDTTYADTQKQRYLERQIRGWKRKAAAAEPGTKEREIADRHVKAYQQEMRDHLAATGLLRQSDRERARSDERTEPNTLKKVVRDAEAKDKAQAGPVSQQTQDAIDKARQAMPIIRSDWEKLRSGSGDNAYRKDRHGRLLPPKSYEERLDLMLDAGRSLQKDIQQVFDGDTKLAELRRTAEGLRGRPAHKDAMKDVRKRERHLILDTLGKARPMGGEFSAKHAPASLLQQEPFKGQDARRADDDWEKVLQEAAKHFPADWHNELSKKKLDVMAAPRPFYSSWYDVLAIHPKSYRSPGYDGGFNTYRQEAATHELGHRMENNIPGVNELTYTYRSRRSTNGGALERLRDMADLYPGYPKGVEFAYKDKWAVPYTGRSYLPEDHPDPASDNGEVFSTGLQDLFGRSSFRYDSGDDLQAFVLGVLVVL